MAIRQVDGAAPAYPMYMIFDETLRAAGPYDGKPTHGWTQVMSRYAWSDDNRAEIARGWIRSAPTLDALERELDLPDGLDRSVARWNALCAHGEDTDFGRTRMLAPFGARAYYAVEISPTMLNTQGGPRRNAQAQIVRPDGTPIPRLYSAGELGSIYSYMYQGTGNIGECFAFGRIAARHAMTLRRGSRCNTQWGGTPESTRNAHRVPAPRHVSSGAVRPQAWRTSGQLRRVHPFELSLAVQTRFTYLGALEIVAHADMQATMPSTSSSMRSPSMKSSGRDDWCQSQSRRRVQCVDGAHPLNTAWNLVRHVAGVEVLHQDTVVPEPDLQMIGIRNLVGGDNVRTHRRKRIARLHLEENVAVQAQATRRAVDEVHVTENVCHRLAGGNIARALANDQRQFRLALEYRGSDVRATPWCRRRQSRPSTPCETH